MNSTVLGALIAVGGIVLGAVLSVYGQWLLQRGRDRRDAEAVLARYREPLLSATVDLQYSLFNILCDRFLWRLVYKNEGGRREIAIDSTLYNFAQYFGWREVLHREAQFLDFDEVAETRKVNELLRRVTSRFSDKEPPGDELFRLFKAEQRGIGELMLADGGGRLVCVGFAEFQERRVGRLAGWLDKLQTDLEELSKIEYPSNERLREIQTRLVDLAERLDPRRVRLPERGLPRASVGCGERASFLTDLRDRQGDPAARVLAEILDWAVSHGLGLRWGNETVIATVALVLRHAGQEHEPISIRSDGSLWINFRSLTEPPFDDLDRRREFAERLNQVQGLAITDDQLDGYPNATLEPLVPAGRLTPFFAALEWFRQQVNEQAPAPRPAP